MTAGKKINNPPKKHNKTPKLIYSVFPSIIFLLKFLYWELWSTGTDCPGRWLSHHPWRCLKNM